MNAISAIGESHQDRHRVTAELAAARGGPPTLTTAGLVGLIETACAALLEQTLGPSTRCSTERVSVSCDGQALVGDDIVVRVIAKNVAGPHMTFDIHVSGSALLASGTITQLLDQQPVLATGPRWAVELPTPTRDLDQGRADLDRWGYCLVADAVTGDQLTRVRDRLNEQAAAEARAGVAIFDTGAHPSKPERRGRNQRLQSLVGKGDEFHELALHPEVSALLEHSLGERYLMTSYSANITAPDCEPQMLHQDQGYVSAPQPHYAICTNVVWMLDEMTVENGGTRVVPGSHLWRHAPGPSDPAEVVLTAPAGTAAIVDGRCWHAAGPNRSQHRRRALLNNFCRAWVRQQENPFLSLSPEVLAGLSQPMKRLLGFKTWGTLGGVPHPGGVDARGWVSAPDRYIIRMA